MNLSKAAAAMGRKGGKAKVPKGFSTMKQARLKKIAKAAIKKRWALQRERERNAISNTSRSRSASQSEGGDPC